MLPTRNAIIGYTVGYIISSFTVLLKIFTRIKYLAGLKADDYLILVAWAIFTGAMASIYLMLANGLQAPFIQWLFYDADKLAKLLQGFFISIQMYALGILFCKLSLITLYRQITQRAQTLKHIGQYLLVLEVACVLYTISSNIAALFWCRPLRAFWTMMPIVQSPEYCSRTFPKQIIYMFSGFNIVTDLCIMIVPYFFLTRASLQHRTQKIALYVLLGIGGFIIIATIMKIVIIAHEWDVQSLVFWSFIESCVALTITCFPSLPPLIWKKTKLGSHSSQSGTGHSDNIPRSKLRSANMREDDLLPSDDDEVLVSESHGTGTNGTRMSTIMTNEDKVFIKSHVQEHSSDIERHGGRV